MNGATAQARVLVDELVRHGVTDAVLCPGSRNAPLAFALARAEALGLLRLHVRIDERSAGFLALGLSLASDRPVPVVVTSGTAVANLHPAMLEAAHAGIGLVALTADRPPGVIGTGASQTISQFGLFGTAVRWAGALAVPETRQGPGAAQEPEIRRWRATVARALAATAGAGAPGPVHLNLPYAEPLVPDDTVAGGADLLGPEIPPGRVDGAAWTVVTRPAGAMPPLPLDVCGRTLVIAGSGGPAPDPGLLGGAPLVAEPSSRWWRYGLRSGPWLLGRPELRPTQVVVLGRPTLHRSVATLLAQPELSVYVDPGPDGAPWPDVPGTVRAVGRLPALVPPEDWRRAWRAADRSASSILDAALDDGVADGAPGLRLARETVRVQPDGGQLVLGPSNPVRDVALAAVPRPGLVVRSNRGVAGIDGTVSTALGAALAHEGPTALLLGDLTLLHDATGLFGAPAERAPDLTVVLLDDDGGGIFHLLEQGAPEYAHAFERVFGTPTGADLLGLVRAAGWTAANWSGDPAELAAFPGSGRRLVRVTASRRGLRDAHAALRRALTTTADGIVHNGHRRGETIVDSRG